MNFLLLLVLLPVLAIFVGGITLGIYYERSYTGGR